MPIPQVGAHAPDFELPDQTGARLRLSDLRGRTVVLYFYPKADTPGCTQEACQFRDDLAGFGEKDVVLLGISPDPVQAQAKFGVKYGLPFPLLADADHAVSEAYGVWGLKKFLGKEYMGVRRTTFVIDEQGRIARVFENVKPDAHSREVLAAL
jgi:peroxiredoxin Q/BCP